MMNVEKQCYIDIYLDTFEKIHSFNLAEFSIKVFKKIILKVQKTLKFTYFSFWLDIFFDKIL